MSEFTKLIHQDGKGHPGAPSAIYTAGMMQDATETQLGENLSLVCAQMGIEYIRYSSADRNGLGPPEVLEKLRFCHLLQNLKTAIGLVKSKPIIIAHSLSGWPAILAAMDPVVNSQIAGLILLAPGINVLEAEFEKALEFLQNKAAEGDKECVEKLENMKKGLLVYVDHESKGFCFPFYKKFVVSASPHKVNIATDAPELPISQPITIIHGSKDERVKIEESRKLFEKLPKSTKADFIERGNLRHDFDGKEAFETVRYELLKMVDIVTPNWAGTVYKPGTHSATSFLEMSKEEFVIHEKASNAQKPKFTIRNRTTNQTLDKQYFYEQFPGSQDE